MAHLFKQMYVDEVDFDSLTIEKLVELVFTEMVFCKIEQLGKEKIVKYDKINGNPWTGFRKCFEILDDEERWITYAERALSMLDHDVMWQGIVETCKILKYPEPSTMHREYFERLFDLSCFVWYQLYSELERTVGVNNLLDYVLCVCKLKCNTSM